MITDSLQKIIYNKNKGLYWKIIYSPFYLLSVVYSLILNIRKTLYDKQLILKKNRLQCKVISIGNITLGGTGKTPMVIYLAEHFYNKGKKIAVLSRGYKGENKSELLVSDGKDILASYKESGEEPYMIALRLKDTPVMTGKDRYKAASLLINKIKDIDMIILDDGFQHIALERDIDIVLVDAINPFGNGYVFPRGILREDISNIKRATAFIITRMEEVNSSIYLEYITKTIKFYNNSAPIFKAYLAPTKLINVANDRMADIRKLDGSSVIAVSAIGNSKSFINMLYRLGVKKVEEIKYIDHYIYNKKDIEELFDKARDGNFDMIVTTEKDAVKIKEFLPGTDINIFSLRVEITKIEDNIWEEIRRQLN